MLREKVISAVGWSAAIKIGFQIVTWGVTLLVIRILSPNDYGLMAISQIFINIMSGVANVGLADALVQRDHTPRPVVASVFGALLSMSFVFAILLIAAAYPIADWYGDQRLVPLIQVTSFGFLANGLTTIPRVFMTKSLEVRPVFLIEMSSGVASSLVVITLAYSGYGVWALMWGWLSSNAIRMVAFFVVARQHYMWPRFNFADVRPFVSYGFYRTLDYLAWIAYTSADTLIIGRLLGPTPLGFYAVALNFAGMPLSKIAPIINSVAFPAFALVQTNPSEARFFATKAMRMAATVAVPIFFGIAAISPEIVHLIFGPKWAPAEPMLQVLSLSVSFRAILLVLPNYLQGIGAARAGFWCTAAGLFIFPPAIAIGCQWGVMGACYAWLAGYPIVFAINAWIGARYGGLSLRDILLLPGPPLLAGAAMIVGVTLLRPLLVDHVHDAARMALLVVAGGAIYTGVLALFFRPLLAELASLRPKRSAAA